MIDVSTKNVINVGAYIHDTKNANVSRIVAQLPLKNKYKSLTVAENLKRKKSELFELIPDNINSFSDTEWNNFKNKIMINYNMNNNGTIYENKNNYLIFEHQKIKDTEGQPKDVFFINGEKLEVNDKNLSKFDKIVMFFKEVKQNYNETNISKKNKELFKTKLVPKKCFYSKKELNHLYDKATMKSTINKVIDETLETIDTIMHKYFGVYKEPKTKI